jgi:hypothetical protein
MAKAARQTEQEELIPEPVTETIVYRPGPLDPSVTTWCGHKFEANVPKEIRGHSAGTDREKLNLHLIERARENKLFQVGNERPKRKPIYDPVTAEEYRLYIVDWLQSPELNSPATRAEDLVARFSKDRELQIKCGVGTDDYEYIGTLFMPKLHQLAKRDEMNEAQVASMWIRYGYNQLPW